MLVKVSQLMKDLGVTRVTIYNWIKAGKIQCVKSPTGRHYITQEEYTRIMNGKGSKEVE